MSQCNDCVFKIWEYCARTELFAHSFFVKFISCGMSCPRRRYARQLPICFLVNCAPCNNAPRGAAGFIWVNKNKKKKEKKRDREKLGETQNEREKPGFVNIGGRQVEQQCPKYKMSIC